MKASLCAFVLVFSTAAAVSADLTPTRSPEDIIQMIYTIYQPWKEGTVSFLSRQDASQYFDKDLIELNRKDSECAEKTGEVCNLDFDPIFNAQDYDEAHKLNLDVKKISTLGTVATYQVSFTNTKRMRLIYSFQKTSAGWRISDIKYPSGDSLKKLLSKKLK